MKTRKDILKVFRGLGALGIVARSNFMCCQTCGHAKIARDLPKGKVGYVFWHQQDEERLRESGTVCLAYGGRDGSGEGLRVGRLITEAFRLHGFEVNWDGSVSTRPEILNIEIKGGAR